MPTRRQLIQKITLNANASSVTFSNIPQNYTDLVIKFTWRGTAAGSGAGLRVNGDTGSNYSYRALRASGTTAESFNSATWVSSFGTVYDEFIFWGVSTSAFTANTFASGDIYIPNYTSSNSKSVSIKVSPEDNSTTVTTPYIVAGLWSGTNAISSLTFMVDPNASGSPIIAANSTFYLYGITHVPIIRGGTVTVPGDGFKYHTFRSSGSFQVVEPGNVEYLVVAGGGAAGNAARFAGGGGAGGLLNGRLRLAPGQHTATVGAGGPVSGTTAACKGSDSVLASITAVGGGGGSVETLSPGTGGSGGGGHGGLTGQAGAAGTSGQGNSGGSGSSATYRTAGGGGGAGGVGGNGAQNGGNGGSGLTVWGYTYAGGGGGSAYEYTDATGSPGSGGTGGGGAGGRYRTTNGVASYDATAGTSNTGGGGGGGAWGGANGSNSAAGGSGIVIIRYPYDGN